MDKMDFANNLFEAIDTIVDKKLKALQFDRCIVAHLLGSSADILKTQVQIKYQNQILTATPLCPLNSKDDYNQRGVYVLVPNNDFTQELFIIGLTPHVSPKTIEDQQGD